MTRLTINAVNAALKAAGAAEELVKGMAIFTLTVALPTNGMQQ